MYWRAVLYGLTAALLVSIPRLLWKTQPILLEIAPFAVIALGVLVVVINQVIRNRQKAGYAGVADLLLHIHESPYVEHKERWWLRSLTSFILTVFGIKAGPEGAAIETNHAAAVELRSSESSWFEQQRRTDVACSLSAGMAAAFGSPFAAVILPIEMRIGGNFVPVVLSAICAAFFMSNFEKFLDLGTMSVAAWSDGFDAEILLNWKFLVSTIVVAMACGVLGAGVVSFVKLGRSTLDALFAKSNVLRVITGSFLIFAALFALDLEHRSLFHHFQEMIELQYEFKEAIVYGIFTALVFALVMITFGTAGVFWPLFGLGAFVGYSYGSLHSDIQIYAMLVGAASMVGGALGVPMTAAIIVASLTQNYAVILPVIIGAVVAKEVMRLIRSQGLIEENLASRGLSLSSGQSKTVLEKIKIRRVMVKDFVVVNENDRLEKLKDSLSQSKYPFLPVINTKKRFLGLLSAGMIEEIVQNERSNQLIEAKDLLYQNKQDFPRIYADENLTRVSGLFKDSPVLPVFDDVEEVAGLLFTHHVRIAYDQEVAKRSLAYIAREFRKKK